MQIFSHLSNKLAIGIGAILVAIGNIATAPQTWIFFHEEECPQDLLRNK